MGLAGGLATNGALSSSSVSTANWGPSGCVGENMPRALVTNTTLTATVSGTLRMFAGPVVPAGATVSNVSVQSGTTAGASLTASFVGIYNQSLQLLASSVNVTTASWGAQTLRTWNLATALNGSTGGGTWTPTTTIPVYIGLVIVGTTQPTFSGAGGAVALGGLAPDQNANTSDVSLTFGNLPTTASALGSALGALPYCYLS